MKLKSTKQGIIVIVSYILILSVVVIILIHISNLNNHKQEEVPEQDNSVNVSDLEAKDETINETDFQPVDGIRHINIYTVDRELRNVITQYAKEHWDFAYSLNCYTDEMVYSSTDIMNIVADKLVNDPSSIDIYCVPSYAHDFIKGELSAYACTYEELGIDIYEALEKSDIPQYAIDNGSNPEGNLIALPFLSTVSVFAYRRSVAKEVWGTDDPITIANVIGGGTERWEDFKKAAITLKENGYYIAPGFKDLIYSIDLRNSTGTEINPQWEEFMDVSKYLYDKGCIKDTDAWTDGWYEDLDGLRNKVFGYITDTDIYQYLNLSNTAGDWAICMPPFVTVNDPYTGALVNKNSSNKDIIGPFIEWLTLDSSKTGLQYQLATGTYNHNDKLSVISGTVLKNADSKREFLGGQNINSIVYEALNKPVGQFYDFSQSILYLEDAIKAYLWGDKDKATVMEEYKRAANLTSQAATGS